MWLISPEVGFFSIVEKPWDVQNDTLTIRARVRQDLESLKDRYIPELSGIAEDKTADYQFRATAPRESVALAMAAITRGIKYDNVKDRVAVVQGVERAIVYQSVWSALRRLQTRPVQPRIPTIYASIGRRVDVLGTDEEENSPEGL